MRRVAIGSSALCAASALLSGLGPFSYLLGAIQPLLFVAIPGWALYFAARSLTLRRERDVISAQGPGGELVQVASMAGFRRRSGIEPGDEAEVHFAAAEDCFRASRYTDAVAACERSLALQPTLPAQLNLAVALLNTGDTAAAGEALELGLQRARLRGETAFEAAFELDMGAVRARQSRFDEALGHFGGGRDLFHRIDDERGEADALVGAAAVHAHTGRAVEARQGCEQALAVYRRLGSTLGRANALSTLGFAVAESGQLDAALRLLKAALKLHARIDNPLGEAQTSNHIGNVHFRQGALDEARQAYESASQLYARVGNPVGEASALVNAGNVRFRQGFLEEALEAYDRALAVHVGSGNALGQANTLTNVGSALVRQKKLSDALEVLQRAKELYDRIGVSNRGSQAAGRLIERLERQRQRVQERHRKAGTQDA